jgi:hypothetical protein
MLENGDNAKILFSSNVEETWTLSVMNFVWLSSNPMSSLSFTL